MNICLAKNWHSLNRAPGYVSQPIHSLSINSIPFNQFNDISHFFPIQTCKKIFIPACMRI